MELREGPIPFEPGRVYATSRELALLELKNGQLVTREADYREKAVLRFLAQIPAYTEIRFVRNENDSARCELFVFELCAAHGAAAAGTRFVAHENHCDARNDYSRKHHPEKRQGWEAKMTALGH